MVRRSAATCERGDDCQSRRFVTAQMRGETVTDSDRPEADLPLETSIPGAPLESILRTEELRSRPSRSPDYETENRALVALASALADSPRTILQTLADKVFEVLHADSAGLSLLTTDEKRFYWAAVAGAWRPRIGAEAPRHFGPCGDVLDHNGPMLFNHWERRYPYLSSAMPLADEGLLVPFYVNGRPVGTIWAVSHDSRRRFDAEDLRLLERMSRFASAAYQVVESIKHLTSEIAAREKAEAAVRRLADGLEAQVRVRTEELECSTRELLTTNTELEREIAGRKLVERRLRQEESGLKRSEAFLTEAQHLSRTGSFSWRVATDEHTWSAELYRIFEFDPSLPVTLERILTRVHPEDLPMVHEMIDQARGDGSDVECEHRLLMPDRSIKYLHMVAHKTGDHDGRSEHIGAVQDVTRRRLSEAALAKARSELAHVARVTSLGTLTASIAHEVNQPLSGIITNASTCLRMLDADPPNIDGARDTARRMIRDGNRASDVITRLRALFKNKDAMVEAVDLNEAAREVIALSLSDLQRHQVIVRTELANDLPCVTGDRIQLQQVVLNLLRNASDAMSGVYDRPRLLVIRTKRGDGDDVELSVEDAGVGFDERAADRLFEPFYTTKNDGMGMGLSVSRSIIESHHGRLWAVPTAGRGATFSFSIPRGPHGGAVALATHLSAGEDRSALLGDSADRVETNRFEVHSAAYVSRPAVERRAG
jgi:signal transduction histidine kinase/GAF domain-containing protein